MTVSRVVWEHVVEPTVVRPSRDCGDPLAPDQWRTVSRVAEALFPVVPRACRFLMGGVNVYARDLRSCGALQTSRYFALQCAGEAGSARCVDWIIKSKQTRNNRKECITVLRGLCLGGHIEMAKELVEGGDTPWSGCSLLRWPVNDPDVLDDIRAIQYHCRGYSRSLLYDACKGGNLDVVKWVISKFHGSGIESWELPMPFRVALREGHLDVVKWMASSTDVVGACSAMVNDKDPLCNLGEFIGSPSLEVIQFCTELFCGDECPPEVAGFTVLKSFVEQNSMSSSNEADLEEVCDWIKKRFALRIPPGEYYYLENSKAIKWFMKSFWVQPKPGDLHTACVLGDADLIEWLMAHFSEIVGAVTPATFIDACGNRDSVSFVKFLLPKTEPRLTRKQLNECLASSLARNNTSVADWLENTFHLMDKVNASPTVTNEVLLKLFSCKLADGTAGIQWFLSQCVLSNIREGVVIKGVEDLLQRGCISSAIILLDTFDVPPIGHCYWISNISVSQAKEVLSRGKFSLEHIADTFSACESPQSGKVVKWFVQQFHLDESEHVTIDNLLIQLMASNKRSCLEWLIRKFHVTLTQFGRIYESRATLFTSIWTSIDTWKMLMRVFPEMTASFAMEHLREVVTATPLHIQASKKSLGVMQVDDEVNNWGPWLW
ncbi:hypothetical protein Pelo_1200 [Pelomyxa schiedti]|nr:hypothetical protein Pelo_1200 [Pelomyxa schiedti]